MERSETEFSASINATDKAASPTVAGTARNSFRQLDRALDFKVALQWLEQDSKDDFFPDPFHYRDLATRSEDFLNRIERSKYQLKASRSDRYWVPKSRYLNREAVLLRPQTRLIYLALLHQLIPLLAPKLDKQQYSYRIVGDIDVTIGDYPFPTRVRMRQWLEFENDFRAACLCDGPAVIILTDLSAFYDHISIVELIHSLKLLMTREESRKAEPLLDQLKKVLLTDASSTGFGVPQNYDPSSFFCSAHLAKLDARMVQLGHSYFRFMDDIRIVSDSEDQAPNALYDLQEECQSAGLFLNAKKTKVIVKDDGVAFLELVSVEDDRLLSEIETTIATKNSVAITECIPSLFERLEYHNRELGEERKFRAFATKLNDIAEFEELREAVVPRLKDFAVDKLVSQPERTREWVRLLSWDVDSTVQRKVLDLLRNPTYNRLSWPKLWLLELLLRADYLEREVFDEVQCLATSHECAPVRARGILVIGKFGDNKERDRIARKYFESATPYEVKRAVVISIQELPSEVRQKHYDRFLEIDDDVTELILYLRTFKKPRYTTYSLINRKLPERPIVLPERPNKAIGLVEGKIVRFPLALHDIGYDGGAQ
jgi:hypothetical protein